MAESKQISAIPEPQAAALSPENTSGLRDKRVRPEGVVPKQAQGYVVAGLAVLILMAVMFSKNHPKPASKDAPLPPPVMSTDMNQWKIQELEQDLSADQRQGQQQALTQKIGAGTSPAGNAAVAINATPVATAPVSQPIEPPRDPVADAERAMTFKARFASNLVSANDGVSRPLAESTDRHGSIAASTAARPTEPPQVQFAANKRAPEVNVNSAHGQPYVVFEGTIIDTVLVNRLDGEFAGPVKVLVTNPIYSQAFPPL
jgi:type IV secretory pathway VirB10-like protein